MVPAKHETDPKIQNENKYCILMANHLNVHNILTGWFPQEPVGHVLGNIMCVTIPK